MAHHCSAAVVTCEDFRLHRRRGGENFINDYITWLKADCDLITRGGCIQDLVRPQPGYDDSLLRDLTVSVELHHVQTIHLIGHEDCGAYAHFNFQDRQTELAQHHADLRDARRILNARFPDVEVRLRFAELMTGSTDRWRMTEVE